MDFKGAVCMAQDYAADAGAVEKINYGFHCRGPIQVDWAKQRFPGWNKEWEQDMNNAEFPAQ